MLNINTDDLNYTGGFFDGEGSVGIYAYYYGSNHPIYKLVASVANNNRHVLEYIRDYVSPDIPCLIKGVGRKDNPTHCLQLTWECDNAAKILERLLPYIKIKLAEAELGIQFQNMIRNKTGSRNRKLTDNEVNDRNILVDKIKLLKDTRDE